MANVPERRLGVVSSNVAASLDGAVVLYDVATRQPIGDPLNAGDAGAEAVAFTPDGQTLASSYQQGQVMLWDIDPNSWQQRACATAGRNLTRDEWHQYLGDRPYRKTCAQWPAGTCRALRAQIKAVPQRLREPLFCAVPDY
jgi:hypothetical protein